MLGVARDPCLHTNPSCTIVYGVVMVLEVVGDQPAASFVNGAQRNWSRAGTRRGIVRSPDLDLFVLDNSRKQFHDGQKQFQDVLKHANVLCLKF